MGLTSVCSYRNAPMVISNSLVIVGSSNHRVQNFWSAGAVWVFAVTSNTRLTYRQQLTAPTPSSSEQFGAALTTVSHVVPSTAAPLPAHQQHVQHGSYVFVSCEGDRVGFNSFAGSVIVYTITTSTTRPLSYHSIISSPQSIVQGYFGSSVGVHLPGITPAHLTLYMLLAEHHRRWHGALRRCTT